MTARKNPDLRDVLAEGGDADGQPATNLGDVWIAGDGSVDTQADGPGVGIGVEAADGNAHVEIVSPAGGVAYQDFTIPGQDFMARVAWDDAAQEFKIETGAHTVTIDAGGLKVDGNEIISFAGWSTLGDDPATVSANGGSLLNLIQLGVALATNAAFSVADDGGGHVLVSAVGNNFMGDGGSDGVKLYSLGRLTITGGSGVSDPMLHIHVGPDSVGGIEVDLPNGDHLFDLTAEGRLNLASKDAIVARIGQLFLGTGGGPDLGSLVIYPSGSSSACGVRLEDQTGATIFDIAPETGAVTLHTALSVANGGTGASTAAGARTNLGVPAGSGTSTGTNTGDQTSVSGNAGTATKLATARNIDGQSFDGSAAITVIAPGTHASTTKATPVDADELPLADSAASFVLKKLTWANLKATIKAYTDTLYPAGSGTSSGTNTGDQTSVSGNAGTATALQTARAIDGQSFDGTAAITVIAPGTHAATGKTTPVDADELPLVDSAASNVLKKLTLANVKATLKTYFDTVYPLASLEWQGAEFRSSKIGTWTDAQSLGAGYPYANFYYNSGNTQNDATTWNFPIALPAGTYTFFCTTQQFNVNAIQTWEWSTDGTTWNSLLTYDGYNAGLQQGVQNKVTGLTISSAFSWLRVRAATRNASASGWTIVLSTIRLFRTA